MRHLFVRYRKALLPIPLLVLGYGLGSSYSTPDPKSVFTTIPSQSTSAHVIELENTQSMPHRSLAQVAPIQESHQSEIDSLIELENDASSQTHLEKRRQKREEILQKMNLSPEATLGLFRERFTQLSPQEDTFQRAVLVQTLLRIEANEADKSQILHEFAQNSLRDFGCDSSEAFKSEWLSILTIGSNLESSELRTQLHLSLLSEVKRECDPEEITWAQQILDAHF